MFNTIDLFFLFVFTEALDKIMYFLWDFKYLENCSNWMHRIEHSTLLSDTANNKFDFPVFLAKKNQMTDGNH